MSHDRKRSSRYKPIVTRRHYVMDVEYIRTENHGMFREEYFNQLQKEMEGLELIKVVGVATSHVFYGEKLIGTFRHYKYTVAFIPRDVWWVASTLTVEEHSYYYHLQQRLKSSGWQFTELGIFPYDARHEPF